jgi:hypothetical protein
MNKRFLRSATGAVVLTLAGMLPARAATDFLWPTWSLTGGSYQLTADDSIRVDAAGSRPGSNVSLAADFGLPEDTTPALFSVDWAFARRHSLGVRYYSFDRDGSRTASRIVTIRDVTFPVGARLDTKSDTTSIEGVYDYWFLRHDRVGLGGSFGLVWLSLDASATGTVMVGSAGATETRRVEASTDLPVPMIGLAFKASPWSRLILHADGRYLPSVTIGDVDGEAASYSFGADFYLLGNFALGASYVGTTYKVDLDQDSWRGSVDLNRKGWQGYARLSF